MVIRHCPQCSAAVECKSNTGSVPCSDCSRRCEVEGCDSPHEAVGLCNKHYQRKRAAARPKKYAHTCDFCGTSFESNRRVSNCCGSPACKKERANAYSRDYTKRNGHSRRYYWMRTCTFCGAEYKATHKNGKHCSDCKGIAIVAARFPENLPVYKAFRDGTAQDALDAIRGRCTVTPDGCWAWQGTRTDAGYGLVSTGRQARIPQEFTHRVTLGLALGVSLEGIVVHHKCAYPPCCNPDHLQPVTQQENIAEMEARRVYITRIQRLEQALRKVDPDNPILQELPLDV